MANNSSKVADPTKAALTIFQELPSLSEAEFFARLEGMHIPNIVHEEAWKQYSAMVKAKVSADLALFDNPIIPPKHFGFGVESEYAYHGTFVGDAEGNVEPILVFSNKKWLREASFKEYGLRFLGYPDYSQNTHFYYWSRSNVKAWLSGDVTALPLPELYDKVKVYVKKYVYHPDETVYDVITCYILASHVWVAFDAFPRLFVHAPSNSGKSQLIRVIRNLCFKPTLTGDASKASLMRAAETAWGVMIFDNFDNLPEEQKAGVIHFIEVSYQGDLASMRAEKKGNGFVPMTFSVGVPVAIGTIDLSKFSEASKNRGIEITMEQATTQNYEEIPSGKPTEDSVEIRDALYVWGLENAMKVKEEAVNTPTTLKARSAQIAKPILYIATQKSPELAKEIEKWLANCFETYHNIEESDEKMTILMAIWNHVKDRKEREIRLKVKDITVPLLFEQGIEQNLTFGDDTKKNPAFSKELAKWGRKVSAELRNIPQTTNYGSSGYKVWTIIRKRLLQYVARYGILSEEEKQTQMGDSNEN